MTVGIVGLGLMGGSLARDLSAGNWRVQGTDRDPRTERKALAAGVIEGPIRIDEVDLVVLAVPVRSVPGWVRWLARELRRGGAVDGAVLTDLGSTKRSVMAAAEVAGLGSRFVGSHPLAGDDRSGWDASRTGLYQGATVWICPLEAASPEAVDRVEALWRAVGADTRRIDPAAHDRLMARVSHLPQVVASALAAALAGSGIAAGELGPGGRDTMRLAGSDPRVWTDILLDNADEVGPALDAVMAALARFREAVRSGEPEAVGALLEAARSWRYDAGGEGRSTPRIRGDVGGKNASSR